MFSINTWPPTAVVFSPEDLAKPYTLCSYTHRMFHFSEAGWLAAVVETTYFTRAKSNRAFQIHTIDRFFCIFEFNHVVLICSLAVNRS